MKTLTVAALLCATMALTSAAAVPEEMPGQEPRSERILVSKCVRPPTWTYCNRRLCCFIPTLMTWHQAERNCISLGGHLASVHSTCEYRAIQKLIFKSSHRHPTTWIGGSDRRVENKWLWTDGTCFDYTNWACGEPNNQNGNQHCLQMNFGGQKAWDDLDCCNRLPSVCVK
ncbi:ladderlectin-like isoform 1-T2 [Spinachia spinachia]